MESEDNLSPYAGLASKIRVGQSALMKDLEDRRPELTVRGINDGSVGHGIGAKLIMAYQNSVAASTFSVLNDGVEVGQLGQDNGFKMQLLPGSGGSE